MNGWMDVGATAEKVYEPSEWRLANDFDWSSFTVKKKLVSRFDRLSHFNFQSMH